MGDYSVVHHDDDAVVLLGDCLDVLSALSDDSVDSVITDPPYALSFMGKDWDSMHPSPLVWKECLRVLKPGGHLLSFGGTRTFHRLAVDIEDAGFEIRDSISWLYGSGFPKSMDVSKAIDKLNGRDMEQQWEGWGTALKPAWEPIIVARKPFRGTVAANVLHYGTGAINVDACRVVTTDKLGGGVNKSESNATRHEGYNRPWRDDPEAQAAKAARSVENTIKAEQLGRWPANVVLDEGMAKVLDEETGTLKSGVPGTRRVEVNNGAAYGQESRKSGPMVGYGDEGGASRFFPTFKYQAKASAKERPSVNGLAHPTVKPVDLMRWLVKLVTPPGGVVLDPFAGSGTTGEAALAEGHSVVLIERESTYVPLIKERLARQ